MNVIAPPHPTPPQRSITYVWKLQKNVQWRSITYVRKLQKNGQWRSITYVCKWQWTLLPHPTPPHPIKIYAFCWTVKSPSAQTSINNVGINHAILSNLLDKCGTVMFIVACTWSRYNVIFSGVTQSGPQSTSYFGPNSQPSCTATVSESTKVPMPSQTRSWWVSNCEYLQTYRNRVSNGSGRSKHCDIIRIIG